ELGALGVSAEVQTAEVVPRQAGDGRPVTAARVQNIVARVQGTANSRALMLAAHYDSVPTGPGASDDAAGVATLLETLRALKTGAQLKNDLIILITDAEELGLLGAHAFAEEHPWMRDVGLVLNFEARGTGGPSFMFETSDGNGALIRELGDAAPHTVASSLMYAVYKRLPNDTDMTVFKRAGAAGLNFAYADRITGYHTALDSADELDERSLQHHGSYALSLARRFGGRDLGDLRSRDAVYFNALGPFFVRYSEAWVVPLTTFVGALFIAVVLWGLRKKALSVGGMIAGLLAFLLAAGLAALLTTGVWRVARMLHAGFGSLPWQRPYDIWPYVLGFVLLTIAALAGLYAFMFRKTSAANLLAGALAWWLALLIFSTIVLPLGAYVFAWPLLFAIVGLALALASGDGSFGSAKSLGVVALCAAPGVALVAPLVYMFFLMLGPNLGGGFMLLVALVAGLLIPCFRALTLRKRWLLPAFAALLGICFIVVGLARAGFDARHRKTNSVFYFLDADAGRARWISTDAASDEWTSQFIKPDAAQEGSLAAVLPWGRQQTREAEASVVALAAPDVRVLEDRTDGDVRTVRLRLASARRAPMLIFYTGPESGVLRATLDGKTLIDEDSKTTDGTPATLRVNFAAPPPEGLELLLETRTGTPLSLIVEDLSFGLPEAPGQ
ncbi:MAG: M20/M25/M40 family metallo-hydrolase, partial [Rubrivivax sp.]|nr:M20/M25/M40 family metallo-hydrolase [Pyrinomonadaceae bacterium]